MLRRMKIGGRVNVLIAVPLLALIAFAGVGYWALQQASVRGAEYKSLKMAQELRADTLPPPASLLQAWAEVNQIGVLASSPSGFNSTVHAQIDVHFRTIAKAEHDFNDSMDFWSHQLLDKHVDDSLLGAGRDAGTAFFTVINTNLKDAVAKENPAGVLAAIQDLEWRYSLQQGGVQTALNWAENEVAFREARTNDLLDKVTLLVGGGAALLFLFTLLLSVRVRRMIVRPIRALAAHAKTVAAHDLPEVVQSLHDLPAGAEVPRLPDFQVSSSRDELSELADSFNSVQDAAVDLAAEHARARRVVSENLVNIARRNQNLLGRTLGFISSLEQTERDPENLDNLFRIDHLTTRMRRNAQSLLVLAGAEPTRLWSSPVPVGDVVRAALSEVENYGQVELSELGDVLVTGAIAGEVSHLLAELLENATSFSPPTTAVTVVGRAVPDGHQLAIFDYGLGMSPEDMAVANERLNQVSEFDKESHRMLGFQVVARLASRHAIKVMLTTTPGGTGVTAVVRLPKAILEQPSGELSAHIDLPGATARLTAPLPVVAPVAVAQVTLASINAGDSSGVHSDPLWAAVQAAPNGAVRAREAELPTSTLTALSPLSALKPLATRAHASPTNGGLDPLPKRVRGAQLPDLGAEQSEPAVNRGADDVRATLSSLQRGLDLGRHHGTEE